jgi:hypothetical protein
MRRLRGGAYFDAEGFTLQQFTEFLRYSKGLASYDSVGLRTAVFESVPRNDFMHASGSDGGLGRPGRRS